jgi:hypothetical protein
MPVSLLLLLLGTLLLGTHGRSCVHELLHLAALDHFPAPMLIRPSALVLPLAPHGRLDVAAVTFGLC